MCDGEGTPLVIDITAGQCHESTQFEEVMDAVRIPQSVGRPKQRPEAVSADKGYSAQHIRDWLKDHHIKDVIPTKSNQEPRLNFDREAYRMRNVIERCVGWIKECRRIATRFEKFAVNFLAMLKLAMIDRYFRMGLSDTA